MSDEIVEEFDVDGDGTADGSVTWTDGGGDSSYYEDGAVDVNNDGVQDYGVSDSDEDGDIDTVTGDLDGDGDTTDSWQDVDNDNTVDQSEINLT